MKTQPTAGDFLETTGSAEVAQLRFLTPASTHEPSHLIGTTISVHKDQK
ncbi:MAG: hypothetical protein QG585_606, partial [Patescibacteria group bacterium]|nr:hypothetical protein [Patescibacteria group bacterium]